MAAVDHMINLRFGRLLVLCRVQDAASGNWQYLCQCDCGRQKVVRGSHLRRGEVVSCGCVQREARRTNALKLVKHGHRRRGKRSPTYGSWTAMWFRCTNPRHAAFHRYGGRGVCVCDRWKSFSAFAADMGERPPGTTLDRTDSNGNYEPGNCRWASVQAQANNRCTNRLLTSSGRTQTLSAWARELGIRVSTVRERLRRGWSVGRALEMTG